MSSSSNNNNNSNNNTPAPRRVWSDNKTVYERNEKRRMTFVIYLGLPGCGKSYFTGLLREAVNAAKLSSIVVGRDSFRVQDGVYRYVPEREPMLQKAHLEVLFQLSEKRTYDVVIVDDANLAIEQIVGTLLAIEHEDNNIVFVDFDPHYIDIHLRRLAETGHNMPRERLVNMEWAYMEAAQKLVEMGVQRVVVRSPAKDTWELDYGEFCAESKRYMQEAIGEVMEMANAQYASSFSILSYFAHACPWLKREIFSKYKEMVCGAIKEEKEMEEPEPKKQKN